MRDTGIKVLGPMPWGTHFCQFYQTRQDLLDILIPYFKAGLEHNEFCMWVTSEPLSAAQAREALAREVPDLEAREQAGQIELLDYTQWYTLGGSFDSARVLQGWVDKLAAGERRGFTGLRLSGNTFWLESSGWRDFIAYEAAVDAVIGQYPMLALCTYSLEKCGAAEIMDVVGNHDFALIKHEGRWQLIEDGGRKKIERSLQLSEARYRSLFERMTEGFALHEILLGPDGAPCDYRFLEINPAFEELTGLKRAAVVGKTLSEVLPGEDPKWIRIYGQVALSGQPVHLDEFSPAIGRTYDVFAFSPAPKQFAVLFTDITERRRVEDALRYQADILESVNDAVIATDGDFKITSWNRAAERIYGWKAEEVLGRSSVDILRSELSPDERGAITGALLRGETAGTAVMQRTKDGGSIFVEGYALPLQDGQGKPTGYVAVNRDATEARKKELELRKLNRILAATSRSSQALMRARDEAEYLQEVCGIIAADCGHSMVWVGYAEQDAEQTVRPVAHAGLDQGYLDTLHITWADTERGRGPTGTAIRTARPCLCRNMLTDPHFEPWRQEALKRGYASSMVLPLLFEGRAFGALTIYSKEPDPFSEDEVGLLSQLADDLAYGIQSIRLRDQHAQAEQVLKASREQAQEQVKRLQALMDAAPAIIWIAHDRECRQITGNRAAEVFSRVPAGTNMSKNGPETRRLQHYKVMENGKELAPSEMPVQRVAASGEALSDHHVDFVFDDGRVRSLLGNVTPVRDADGQPAGAIAAFVDITELNRAREALQAANRRKDEFLAMLAHELRNPLAPIRNAAHILRSLENVEPKLLRQREVIERQVLHMTRLLDDLLDVSRITSGRIELKKQPVRVSEILAHAREIAEPLIAARRHALSVTLPEADLSVDGDPDRLAQIVSNLLANAAKYTDEGGRIWLEAAREGAQAVVRVRDTGIGIASETLPTVFDLFVQANHTLDRSQGGLGIGLTVVRNLVQMHGGTVSAQSRGLGAGSEFIIRLPALPAGQAQTGPAAAQTARSTDARRRILVVDDVVDTAESLAEVLTCWGHEVRTAHDGHAALQASRDFRPDLVLLDIGLPGLDGFQVAARIQSEFGPSIRLIAMSGYGQDHDRARATDAGIRHYLVKPVDLEQLQELLL